jgi:Family of unknown function (DUF6768)
MMTDLDDKIKAELERETSEIDKLLAKEGGLPDMVSAAWHGSLRRWIWVTSVVLLPISALMVWCGYEFFTAQNSEDQLYWGICTLLSAMSQIAIKQWQWMEMNRASMMREIKRLELAIATLSSRAH